jgi:hypothetical protein
MKKALFFLTIPFLLMMSTFCGQNFQNPISTPQQGNFGIQVMKSQATCLTHQVAAVNEWDLRNTTNNGPVLDVYATFTFDVDPASITFTGSNSPVGASRGSITLASVPSAGQQAQAQAIYIPGSLDYKPSIPKQIRFQIQCPQNSPKTQYHLVIHGSDNNGTSQEPCVSSLPTTAGQPGFCMDQDGYYNSIASIGVDYSTLVTNTPLTCP